LQFISYFLISQPYVIFMILNGLQHADYGHETTHFVTHAVQFVMENLPSRNVYWAAVDLVDRN